MNTSPDLSRHPCFNENAKGVCGRVHLPVAPRCNIKCNYCDRRYDCVNESRPGVASALLSPAQALHYVGRVLDRDPRITVIGIAGPGDPFANGETLETMRRIRSRYPEMLLCVSTNGFGLLPVVDEIAEIGVSHVTVTVNAVDPEIGRAIYDHVRDGKVIYRGLKAAELLLERQRAGIAALKARGILVKVNTVVIPGVNDRHVAAVAEEMAGLRVDLQNCMALAPNAGTPFEGLPEPDRERMAEVRTQAGRFLPQMKHCRRCRADAVGLLAEDRASERDELLGECAASVELKVQGRPYVAVATSGGGVVNEHLGEAAGFDIWEWGDDGLVRIGRRPVGAVPRGPDRWRALGDLLKDCRAVLVSGAGPIPRAYLEESGTPPIVVSGLIEHAVKSIYLAGELLPSGCGATHCGGGSSCGGDRGGCDF